jgi:hypothetical protein
LLKQPDDAQKLYKIMSVENFLRSTANSYIHFQRVDTYKDFPNADGSDGEQLPLDKFGNENSKFAKDPTYNAAAYYNDCRARTYAYCLSLENSEYIWKEYSNKEGKICLVFEFGKLRQSLNQFIQTASVVYKNAKCHQIFNINYGIVEYVKRAEHQLNQTRLPNPIQYTYIKDEEKYGREKELRVSLSAVGIGNFGLKDGCLLEFSSSLQLQFNFKEAFSKGIIEEILCNDPALMQYLKEEMNKLR